MEPNRLPEAHHGTSEMSVKNCIRRKSFKFIFLYLVLLNAYIILGGPLFIYIEKCRGAKTAYDTSSDKNSELDLANSTKTNMFPLDCTCDNVKITIQLQKHDKNASLAKDTAERFLSTCKAGGLCQPLEVEACSFSYRNVMEWVLFCWEAISTVGYGSKTLKTMEGKLLLIPYSGFGIAFFLSFLGITGSIMKSLISKCIRFFEKRVMKKEQSHHKECKVFVGTFVFTFAISMAYAYFYSKVTGVDFPTSIYFVHCTFSTIGFGDFNMSPTLDNPVGIHVMSVFSWWGLVGASTSVQALADVIEQL